MGPRNENLRRRSNIHGSKSKQKNLKSESNFHNSHETLSIFEKLVAFLYRPTNPKSLGVVRALFGM